jgi:hypothetical protein
MLTQTSAEQTKVHEENKHESMGKCSESNEEDYRMNHVWTNKKSVMEIP